MSLIGLKVFRNWDACIPVSFPETQMIGVNEVFDLIFDGPGVWGDVVFGEELLLSIVVDFVVFEWPDFGRFVFFDVEQVGDFLFLFFETLFVCLFNDHDGRWVSVWLNEWIKFYFYFNKECWTLPYYFLLVLIESWSLNTKVSEKKADEPYKVFILWNNQIGIIW